MTGRKGEPPDILKDGPAGYVSSGLPPTERKRKQRRWKDKPDKAEDPDDRTRHTYYVGDHVHWRLIQLAERYDISISNLVWWMLSKALERVESGEWDLASEMVVLKQKLSLGPKIF